MNPKLERQRESERRHARHQVGALTSALAIAHADLRRNPANPAVRARVERLEHQLADARTALALLEPR